MCGIAGFLDPKRRTGAGDLAAAATALVLIHRGPDSRAAWRDAAA